jgi:ATP-dependent helicase HrpB
VFRRAVLAGYPDRVAQRREPRSPRLRLSNGSGARLGAESGVTEGEFLIAVDVQRQSGHSHRPAASPEAIVRLASRIERGWLVPNQSELVHRFDDQNGTVRAVRLERYDALVLAERPATPDPGVVARLLAEEWHRRGASQADRRLLSRLRFAGRDTPVDDLVERASQSARSLDEIDLRHALPAVVLRSLDRDAPESLVVPSGRSVRLDYGDDGSVSASVKLQELFGLAETPRIGPRSEPILFALLAPNGRPVQLTRDLRSFWDRTYPDVRKELRGRYPKHPWPDDPWTALPTARLKRR